MMTINYTYGTDDPDSILVGLDDTIDYVYGYGGNDTLSEVSTASTTSDDFFFGNMGNDTIVSFWGADVIHGGKGNDKVFLYGTDVREAHGGEGWDVLYIKPVYPNGPGPDGGGVGPDAGGKRHRLDHDPVGHDFDGFEKVVFLESWEHA